MTLSCDGSHELRRSIDVTFLRGKSDQKVL